MEFKVEENIIMWAFRYALGRRTGVVESVICCLMYNWNNLSKFTRNQIIREIDIAIKTDNAGSQCDIKNWQRIKEYNNLLVNKGK